MIAKGIAYWAFLHEPKIEKNNDFKDRYEMSLKLDKASIKLLKEQGITLKEGVEEKNGFDGTYVTFSRNFITAKGKEADPITVVDKNLRPVTENIGNGSTVIVSFRPFAWEKLGKKGVKPILEAVQVLDLVPYEGGGGISEFENYNEDATAFS